MSTTTTTTTATSSTLAYTSGRMPSSPDISVPIGNGVNGYGALNGHGSISRSGLTSTATMASTISTLRSMYPRAARAFIQRDVALTHTLLTSAFAILSPPSLSDAQPDPLDPHRRKWDILRITLESTLYASPLPPSVGRIDALPESLRANMLLSAPSLVANLHLGSCRLFTPAAESGLSSSGSSVNGNLNHSASSRSHVATNASAQPSSAYLPAQILTTLALASLKLDCPEVGRGMVEDWLARREQVDWVREDEAGYRKVLEVYCLHVLPRLEQWEYAEVLVRDNEDWGAEGGNERKRMLASLKSLRDESHHANSQRKHRSLSSLPSSSLLSPSSSGSLTPSASATSSSFPSSISSTSSSSFIASGSGSGLTPRRSPSPARSTSSGSSIDTTSTRTVVPRGRIGGVGIGVGAMTAVAGAGAVYGSRMGTGMSEASSSTLRATGSAKVNGRVNSRMGAAAGQVDSSASRSGSGSRSSARIQPTSVSASSSTSTSPRATSPVPASLRTTTGTSTSTSASRSRHANTNTSANTNTLRALIHHLTLKYLPFLNHYASTTSPISLTRVVLGLLVVLVPIVSFVVRLRGWRDGRGLGRNRAIGSGPSPLLISSASTASVRDVRRRLGMRDRNAIGDGVLRSVWGEVVRSLVDVVKMAGGGLV